MVNLRRFTFFYFQEVKIVERIIVAIVNAIVVVVSEIFSKKGD